MLELNKLNAGFKSSGGVKSVRGGTSNPGILNANKHPSTTATHRVNFLTLFSELDGFAEAAGLPVAALH